MIGIEAYRNYHRSRRHRWVPDLQMADPVLHLRGLLECDRCGPAGLFDQHAHRAVLHAGNEHDGGTRARRAVRVYGMLGIGLLLFCLRGLSSRRGLVRPLAAADVLVLNIGLGMMVFMSLVPAGIYQAWASISHGVWLRARRR